MTLWNGVTCFPAAARQGHSGFVGISSERTLKHVGVHNENVAWPALVTAAGPGTSVPLQQLQGTQGTCSPLSPLHRTFLHYTPHWVFKSSSLHINTESHCQSRAAQVTLMQKILQASASSMDWEEFIILKFLLTLNYIALVFFFLYLLFRCYLKKTFLNKTGLFLLLHWTVKLNVCK